MTFGVDEPEYPASGCALVFGASGGLGRAIAGLLAERGTDVVVTYRSNREPVDSLVREVEGMGRRALVMECDVTDRGAVDGVVDAAKELGPVHTVVSAGGLQFITRPLAEFEPQLFHDVIDTDVRGFFNIAQSTVPVLRDAGGGTITALITCAVARTVPTDALSATPKAAVAMMVRQLATEEAANGIRANAVGPGVIDGGMVPPMRSDPTTAELLDQATAFTPLGRLGDEGEVAEAVAFLASSKARFITGQLVMVDGGLSA